MDPGGFGDGEDGGRMSRAHEGSARPGAGDARGPSGFERPGGSGSEGARRKGLLSLDVPVLLAPNVVRAQRLGSGGVLRISLTPEDEAPQGFLWPLWLTVLAGFAVWLHRRPAAWYFTFGLAAVGLFGMFLLEGAPVATSPSP